VFNRLARMGSGASVPVMVDLLVSRSPGTGTVCENAIPRELPQLNRATRPEKQRKHDNVFMKKRILRTLRPSSPLFPPNPLSHSSLKLPMSTLPPNPPIVKKGGQLRLKGIERNWGKDRGEAWGALVRTFTPFPLCPDPCGELHKLLFYTDHSPTLKNCKEAFAPPLWRSSSKEEKACLICCHKPRLRTLFL